MLYPLIKVSFLYYCSVALLCVISLTALSQSLPQLDSLRSLAKEKQGIEKFDVLYEMVRATAEWNIDSSIAIAHEARELTLIHADSMKLMTANRVLGQLYNRVSKCREADKFLVAALSASIEYNERDVMILVLMNLGVSKLYQGDFGESLKHLHKAKSLVGDKLNDQVLGSIYVNLGLAYYKLEQPQKAIDYLNLALHHFDNQKDIALVLVNLALAFNMLEVEQSANLYLDSAAAMCADGKCPKGVILNLQFAIGYCRYFQGRFDDAERELTQALALTEAWGDVRFQAECMLNLAKAEIKLNKIESAYRRLMVAEKICLQSGIHEFLDDLYLTLADFHLELEEFESASFYLRRYVNDTLRNAEVRNRMLALEVEHAQKVDKEKISAQEKLLGMKEEVIRSQRLGFIGFLGAAILLIALIILLWKHLRQKSTINNLLAERVEERTNVLHQQLTAIEEKHSHEVESLLLAYANIRQGIASLQGLCEIVLKEINPSVAMELKEKFEKVFRQLTGTLKEVEEPDTIL